MQLQRDNRGLWVVKYRNLILHTFKRDAGEAIAFWFDTVEPWRVAERRGLPVKCAC